MIRGTCSLCGGPVGVPTIWHGTIPPKPQCFNCHAFAADGYGPTVQMEHPRRQVTINDSAGTRTIDFVRGDQ